MAPVAPTRALAGVPRREPLEQNNRSECAEHQRNVDACPIAVAEKIEQRQDRDQEQGALGD
jgi:hypothetical protein